MLLKIKNRPNKYTNQSFILKYKNKRDGSFYDTKAIFIGLYDNPITNRYEYCFLIDKKYFGKKCGFISDCGVGETNDWIYLSDFPINRNFKKIVLEHITSKKSDKFFVWVGSNQIIELKPYVTLDAYLKQIKEEL